MSYWGGSWGSSWGNSWGAIGGAAAGGVSKRRRLRFVPVNYNLYDIDAETDASVRLASLALTIKAGSLIVSLPGTAVAKITPIFAPLLPRAGSVVALSPDPIDARMTICAAQVETCSALSVRATSSWNDPSDEELAILLEFALH